MNNLSLKMRITLWYVIIMASVSFFVLVITSYITREIIVRDSQETIIMSVNNLEEKINEIFPETIMHANPTLAKDEIPEHDFYNEGIQMAVYDNNNMLLYGHIPFGIEQKFDFKHDILRVQNYNGKDYYIYDKEINSNTSHYWIKGILCLSDKMDLIELTVQNNLIIVLCFVILAGLGGYLIINKALMPVSIMSKTAKDITNSNNLSERINIEPGKRNDEIRDLANTFDSMLDKIEESFKKEKQFTSDASHELRTPISVILSECEYAEECIETTEDYKESISSIKNQAQKMSKLVAELLTISRMDNDKININLENSNISELLGFVCDEQEEIQTKNITLKREISPDVYANADKLLLTRLFINLISNAYQYSNEGTTITVTLKQDNNKIIFMVQDEGIGIAPEHLSKIWDRFYQVDSSRSNKNSGLGLSMVKWISDVHKGKLEVASKPNEGTTFIFTM